MDEAQLERACVEAMAIAGNIQTVPTSNEDNS
jgi:hypothetical protein